MSTEMLSSPQGSATSLKQHCKSPALSLTLVGLAITVFAGCGNPFTFDPATTVILKVSGATDADQEQIEEEAKELVFEDASWHKLQTLKTSGTLMIKLSPVTDVQEFADRITFGEVTKVDGNTIHLKASRK